MRFQTCSFVQIDAKHVPDKARAVAPGRNDMPWVVASGRTASGESALAFIGGMEMYVYLEVGGVDGAAPLAPAELNDFIKWLGDTARTSIVSARLVSDWTSLNGAEPVHVVRVQPSRPRAIRDLVQLWHGGGAKFRERLLGTRVWEGDVALGTRLAVDNGAAPFCWLNFDNFTPIDGAGRCQHVIAAHVNSMRAEPCAGDSGLAVAPFVLMAIDIECKGLVPRIPNAELGDQVILIGCVTYRDATDSGAESNVIDRIAFIDGTTTPTPAPPEKHQIVVECADEVGILKAFRTYVNHVQPDFITGYNTDKFDWPFLLKRAEMLQVAEFTDMGRLAGVPLEHKVSSFSSGARGTEDDMNLSFVGIVNVDVIRVVRTTHKLRSYKLDFVAKTLLGDSFGKTGVGYKDIPIYHAGTADQRAELIEYCIYDAELSALIAFRERIFDNYISMARVTGVDIHSLITRGQGIKVHTQLLNHCRLRRILVPTLPRRDEPAEPEEEEPLGGKRNTMHATFGRGGSGAVPAKKRHKAKAPAKYAGATVLDPIRGFYVDPITTLDFSSLYPSIMIAHNLCYYTLVRPGECCAHGHDANSSEAVLDCCVLESHIKARFWRAHVREGVLPALLRRLLSERNAAKVEMEARFEIAANESLEPKKRADAKRAASTYNCQQLNLKVSANSIYGFPGAEVGKLPEMRISASVTGFGREMIAYIKNLVETFYRGKVKGISESIDEIELDALVVYGDTDSIMVRFGVKTVADAMTVGKHAATLINAAFRIKYLTRPVAEALRAEHAPAFPTLEAALLANPAHYIPLFIALLVSAICIVFEKVLWPYLLMNKKRYAGNFYMKSALKWDKLHQSGLESVRRDNAVYTASTMKAVIATLMNTRDAIEALMLARRLVRAIARNQVPLDELVISKALSKPPEAYARPESEVHLVVNANRAQREPGSEYRLGDRVPYVFVLRPGQRPGPSPRLVEYACDVDEVRAKNYPPWSDYYVNRQLRKPLTRIFDTVWGEGASNALLFTHDIVTPLPPRTGLAAMFGAPALSSSSAAAAPVPEESRESLERRVRAWRSRPKPSSLMAAFVKS